MSSWKLIRQIVKSIPKITTIPPEIFPIIAEHLEDAIGAPNRVAADRVATELEDLWNEFLARAPESAAAAAIEDLPTETRAAFLLGQLGFAQLLASQVANNRVDDDFLQEMFSPAFSNYIRELSHIELTGKDLAIKVEEADETVSRKLKRLRELGICDFRSEGTKRLNFLTPSAQAIYDEKSEILEIKKINSRNSVNPIIRNLTNNLDPILKSAQSFAPSNLELQ